MRGEKQSVGRSGIRMFLVVALALPCAGTAAHAAQASRGGSGGCSIDVERELWIKNLLVVEDPVRTTWTARPAHPSEGVWSFGRLMANITGLDDPTPAVLDLFLHFDTPQIVNGFEIPPQSLFYQQIIEPWIEASHARGRELDFSIAPLLLNGFVNRLDLRTNALRGGATGAGEGRIVFTFLFPDGRPSLTTLILEYELLARNSAEVKAWAEAWHALGSIPFGPDYNAALEKLVNRYAGPNAAPGRPNGSALRQLRTNEFSRTRPVGFSEFPWQWREFQLSPRTGQLEQTTVAQTVDTSLNRTALLRDYVNENQAEILAGTFRVPLAFRGQPLRSGASNGELFTAFLSAPGILDNEARHVVSLNTCVGCHTEETDTLFFHSLPRRRGEETLLSSFLTGGTVRDPVDRTVTRHFADLQRRVDDLCHVLGSPSIYLETEQPLARVH